MSSVTVCARFRPLSSQERADHGDIVCIKGLDSESFILKDEKEDEFTFSFDKVFYEESDLSQVYEFLAWPIVQDAVDAINGTIITYGQTGAGKTYSIEGTNILESDERKRGLLPRIVEGLFGCIKSSGGTLKHSIKLSMVEIYMEKVRDLFDLSKDDIQITESKSQGILLNGVTEISVSDLAEALKNLSSGIANRAVEETKMNMASSRSHCVYIFTVQQKIKEDDRLKTGKLILVDMAGYERVEKTEAEGKVHKEAKTINKSLSVLENVINALKFSSSGKSNHIPFQDSKLTWILQDALGGTRTALLCCCSPSPSDALESLSNLDFGARIKQIKMSPQDECAKKHGPSSPTKDEPCERILDEVDSAFKGRTLQMISSLQQGVEELASTAEQSGTTVVAVFIQDHIIIGVDSRGSNDHDDPTEEEEATKYIKITDKNKKTFVVGEKILCVKIGMATLCELLHKRILKSMPTTVSNVKQISQRFLDEFNQNDKAFGIVIAGCDKNFEIQCIRRIGTKVLKDDCTDGLASFGTGKDYAKRILHQWYKNTMSVNDAVDLVRRALFEATFYDKYTGGRLNVFVVNKTGIEASEGMVYDVLETYLDLYGEYDEEKILFVLHNSFPEQKEQEKVPPAEVPPAEVPEEKVVVPRAKVFSTEELLGYFQSKYGKRAEAGHAVAHRASRCKKVNEAKARTFFFYRLVFENREDASEVHKKVMEESDGAVKRNPPFMKKFSRLWFDKEKKFAIYVSRSSKSLLQHIIDETIAQEAFKNKIWL